jgi:hypothetical protein
VTERVVDYFGTYLDTLRTLNGDTEKDLARLLYLIDHADVRPVPLWSIPKEMGLGPLEFAKLIEVARESGFVEVGGEAGEEVVDLTSSGAEHLLARRP